MRTKKLTKGSIRTKLQNEAERLWKECIKSRDKVCRLCGGNNILQAHHIFSRTSKRMFLEVDNGVLLCKDCHCSVTNNDATRETLRRKINPDTYDRLYEWSLVKGAFLPWKNISWLEEQVSGLEQLKDELENQSICEKC